MSSGSESAKRRSASLSWHSPASRVSPRIRDLGKITLVRDAKPGAINALYPTAGSLLSARWNEALVAECWPDLLRMAGSLKYGQATASLIVGKWSAASRQNTLAAALKEWGSLRRAIHACIMWNLICQEEVPPNVMLTSRQAGRLAMY